MARTEKELQALKEEAEVLDKKLSEDELNEVTGGYSLGDSIPTPDFDFFSRSDT